MSVDDNFVKLEEWIIPTELQVKKSVGQSFWESLWIWWYAGKQLGIPLGMCTGLRSYYLLYYVDSAWLNNQNCDVEPDRAAVSFHFSFLRGEFAISAN